MTQFRYGPVELYLVGFEGEGPDAKTLNALAELLGTGLVRLLDVIILSKAADGSVTVVEVGEDAAADGFADVDVLSAGLVGEEDVAEFSAHLDPGSSAAVIALELAFERTLAEKLAASGGVVLRSERVPAPVVNALYDLIEQQGA